MERFKLVWLLGIIPLLHGCALPGQATDLALAVVTLPIKLVGVAVGAAIGAAAGMGMMPV